jgi:A/G-specific adenine glycosylase
MPGMWELPEIKVPKRIKKKPLLQLRHSITNTDYRVLVFAESVQKAFNQNTEKRNNGRWISLLSVRELPLTGLTRKILHALDSTLQEIAQFSHKIPLLPDEAFSRESL